MRVFKFFIVLFVSFCMLVILFNKSISTYLEQKYHQDYQVDFVLFNFINDISNKLHTQKDNGLNIKLFEPKIHSEIISSIKNPQDDFLINFGSIQTTFTYNQEEFSIHKLIMEYNQNIKQNQQKEKIIDTSNKQQEDKPQKEVKNTKDDKDENTKNETKVALPQNSQVLLIGDSLMQGTGMFIIKELKQGNVKTKNLAKQSTGLAYKKFYNWDIELQKALNEDKYSAVVVLLGVNDYWDMINPENKSQYLKFGSDGWKNVYSSRVKEIITTARKNQIPLLWYQLPAVKKQTLNQKVQILNEVMEETLKQEKYGIYVKVDDTFGTFESYLKNEEGKKKSVRGNDGVHFTPFGYSLMAKKLLNYVEFENEKNEN